MLTTRPGNLFSFHRPPLSCQSPVNHFDVYMHFSAQGNNHGLERNYGEHGSTPKFYPAPEIWTKSIEILVEKSEPNPLPYWGLFSHKLSGSSVPPLAGHLEPKT